MTTPDQAQGTTGKIEKVETDPDHSLDTADITDLVIMTCTEATLDNNRTDTATIEVAQNNPIQHTRDPLPGHTVIHHTSHITSSPHTQAHQATALRIAVDLIHDLPTNHQNIVHTIKDNTVGDHTPTKETKRFSIGGVRRSR